MLIKNAKINEEGSKTLKKPDKDLKTSGKSKEAQDLGEQKTGEDKESGVLQSEITK